MTPDRAGTSDPRPSLLTARASTARFFYGWLIVLIAFGAMFVSAGTFVTFGQLINPLSQAFGWSVGVIALASTVRQLTNMAAAVPVGRLTDRLGPRRVMTAGALLGGGAYALLYFISEPIVFYVVFTVVVALGFSLMTGTPAQAAVARWFRRRRGMALAVLSMGASLGGVVMAPVVQFLLTHGDWRLVPAAIGAVVLLVLLPLIALGMRDGPEAMGLHPDGERLPAETADGPALARPTPDAQAWSYGQLWRSGNFRLLTLGYLFASSLYTLIEVYQFPILTGRGVDGTTAALFISVYSLSAALSKFGWGYLADRVDLRGLAVIALCANSVALATLAFARAQPFFWLYLLVGGASGGGQSALLPALIAQRFGHRSFGTVAGLFSPLTMLAPVALVPLAGFVYDATHEYTLVFVGTAALAAACSLSLLRLPKASQPQAQEP